MAEALVLEFSRFEFKYVLHRRLRELVEAELGYFMELDPHVETREHSRYFVRSLYLDDPQHTAFHDKIDGLKTRSKFRFRTYADHPSGAPVFLEEKGRTNNRVFKHRMLLAGEGESVTTESLINNLLSEGAANQGLADKFRYEWFRRRIRPVTLIDYWRRPYVSRYDHEFRVTFDENLQAWNTDNLFPPPSASGRRLLPGYTVMEVKFGHKLPAWFHKIIQSFELKRVPLSKICEGMTTLNIAIDL